MSAGRAYFTPIFCLAILLSALTPAAASTPAASYGAIAMGGLQAGVMGLADAARAFWDIFGPGGKLHPGWFLEHKGHLVIEGLLVAIITLLFLQRPQAPRRDEELTEKVGWGQQAAAPDAPQ
jgi:hypothetical protein